MKILYHFVLTWLVLLVYLFKIYGKDTAAAYIQFWLYDEPC